MIEIILLIIGLIAGFIAGYFYGKAKAYQPADVSTINGLTTQIAEIKARFVEIEKSRGELETVREKTSEEKDKRIKEFIENVHKLFKEQGEKYVKSDEEKEKRIKEMMEQSKKFFDLNSLTFPPYILKSTSTVSLNKPLNPINSKVLADIPVKFRCKFFT